MDVIARIITLTLPLLLPGLLLIVVIKKRWLLRLDAPIDANRTIGGKRLFGDNKTYRGIAVMMAGSVGTCWCLWVAYTQAPPLFIHPAFAGYPVFLGVLYAFSYTGGELINSFLKRQLGIPPGKLSARHGAVQRFVDLADGIFLTAAALALLTRVSWTEAAAAAGAGIMFHALTDLLMIRLRLKQQPQQQAAHQRN